MCQQIETALGELCGYKPINIVAASAGCTEKNISMSRFHKKKIHFKVM